MPKSTTTKPPAGGGIAADSGVERHGEEESRRPRRRRSRLVRDLRRPDGPAGRVLRDAGRVLDPGPGEAADRRRFDARSLRRAERRPLFRHHRDRRSADAAATEERRAISSRKMPRPTPSPDDKSRNSNFGARLDNDGAFALASASLRQAMQDMPEIAEISKHIMIEETKQGLNIELVDQNGSSMFPEGSKEPYERTRRLVQRLSAPLKALPYRISISGHTAASQAAGQAGLWAWELSADRANADPQDSGRRGRADRELLHGRRPGRHPAAVSGRPLRRGQPPRHHHPDARGAAHAGQLKALSHTESIFHATIDAGRCCIRRGGV